MINKNFPKSNYLFFLIFLLIGIQLSNRANLSVKALVLIMLITVILYKYLCGNKNKKIFSVTTLLLSLTLFLYLIFINNGIDKNWLLVSNLDQHIAQTRQAYYRADLASIYYKPGGAFYVNTVKNYLDRFTVKISQPLQLSDYFSTKNNSFYHILLLPLFVFGFINLLSYKRNETFLYLALAMLGSIFLPAISAGYFFLPLINTAILNNFILITNRYYQS